MASEVRASTPRTTSERTLEHVAIRPPQRRISLGLRQLWSYRELLYYFAWRDIKIRYKQSVFGVAWALLQPLALMVVFTIFFGRLANIPSDGIPRPIFYYSALVPWTYFSQAVSLGTNSLVSSGGLLTKVYFPRLLLPMSPVVSGLFDFAIAFVFLLGFEGYFLATGSADIEFGARVLLVPVFLLLGIFTALGASLWLSSLNARYRDVRYVVTFLLQFWMFASPVAYPASIVPAQWRTLYFLNPMAGVIEGFRWALTGRGLPPGPSLVVSAGVVLLLAIGGMWYFRKYEGSVADVV